MIARGTPRRTAVRTVSVYAVLAAMLGLTACGGGGQGDRAPSAAAQASPRPTTSVTQRLDRVLRVRLEGIKVAKGSRIAGVLYRGVPSRNDVRSDRAVGGFDVAVDADPFSRLVTVSTRSPFFRRNRPPASPADVTPGRHTLVVWQGPTLTAYSTWLPNAEPGLRVCQVRFDVGVDEITTVTVTGLPQHARPGSSLASATPCHR